MHLAARWFIMAGKGGGQMAYTILIVDDEPSLRSLVRGILEQAGYQVTEAADCRSAVSACRAAARPSRCFIPRE